MQSLPSVTHTPKVVLATLLATAVVATPALADTIPFTSAFTGTISPAAAGQHVVKASHPQVGQTPPAHATASQSSDGAWGSVAASSSADIASGQLGGRAAVSYADAESTLFAAFNSAIGDGFRTFDDNNAPFVWEGQEASFRLDIDGNIFAPAHLANVSAYVALILYSPGSVRPEMNYFGDEGKLDHYLYYVGNPNQRAFYSPDGVNQIELFPTAYLGDPSAGVRIDQAITPGGDFDWVLLMVGSAYLYEPGTLDVDLSHTVTFGYSGPAGARTTSVSGAFGNITDADASVPEPFTVVLLGCGLTACAAGRLRRRG